jgi:hypothetical protein
LLIFGILIIFILEIFFTVFFVYHQPNYYGPLANFFLKKGKARAKQFGRVEIPQEAFIGVLKINKNS